MVTTDDAFIDARLNYETWDTKVPKIHSKNEGSKIIAEVRRNFNSIHLDKQTLNEGNGYRTEGKRSYLINTKSKR